MARKHGKRAVMRLSRVALLLFGGVAVARADARCDKFEGITAENTPYCRNSVCRDYCLVSYPNMLDNCMLGYEEYCRPLQEGGGGQTDACSPITGTNPAYDLFCRSDACNFCKENGSSTGIAACVKEHFGDFCNADGGEPPVNNEFKCSDYSGVTSSLDGWCRSEACDYCKTKIGMEAHCMETEMKEYCKLGTSPPLPGGEISCSEYSGTSPIYDAFCSNDACGYCKLQKDPAGCMAEEYTEYCKHSTDVVTEAPPTPKPTTKPKPPMPDAVDCSSYVGISSTDDSFCSTQACPWCRSQQDPAGCMSQHYSDLCKKKGDGGNEVDPTPGNGIVKAEAQVSLDQVTVGSYYPNWFVYKKIYMGPNAIDKEGQTGQLEQRYTYWPHQMENLVPRLTHVYYAFLDVKKDCWLRDGDPDASWYGKGNGQLPTWIEVPGGACKGAMNDMMSLKSRFPHLKLMISLGGWTYSSNFSNCLKTANGRKKIFEGYQHFVGKMDPNWGKSGAIWNGVDFDWEHPGTKALHENFDPKVDWENYVKLTKEFRNYAQQEGRTQVVMTSAIGVGDTLTLLATKPHVAKQFCESLDFVNLMTYDLHGKWDPQTGHNAQFCEIDKSNPRSAPAPSRGWSVLTSVKKMQDSGCSLSKLTLGMPSYGPGWTGISNGDNGLYQISTKSDLWALWSTFSEKDSIYEAQGILSYWDIKETISRTAGFKTYSKTCPADNGISVPVKWVYNPNIGGGAFASLEDEEVVRQKAAWAKKVGMRGFFFWDAQTDRNGDLLRAGWESWGLSGREKTATGSKKCYDNRRPDFDRNPDGTEVGIKGCHKTQKSDVVNAGEGCAIIRDRAKAKCGDMAYPVGGDRQGKCVNVCTYDWGNGDGPQVGDTVYYICEGDAIPGQ